MSVSWNAGLRECSTHRTYKRAFTHQGLTFQELHSRFRGSGFGRCCRPPVKGRLSSEVWESNSKVDRLVISTNVLCSHRQIVVLKVKCANSLLDVGVDLPLIVGGQTPIPQFIFHHSNPVHTSRCARIARAGTVSDVVLWSDIYF